MITFQKGENPLAGGFLESKRQALHGANSTPADEKPLDTLRAELSRFGLAVRKVNPSGYYATCKKSAHFLRDFADVTALCSRIVRGAEHTIGNAGNLPDSEVFSRSEFGHVAHGSMHGFGAGSAYPQGRQHGVTHVFKPSSTRHLLNTGASGFDTRNGAKTMTNKQRTDKAQATPPADLITQARQRLQEAIGLLQGTPSEADTARALGRVMSASRALKRVMEVKEGGNV